MSLMTRLVAALLLATAGLVFHSSAAMSQPPGYAEQAATELGLKSSWCSSCEIRVTEALVLGNEDSGGANATGIRRDSRGRFYLWSSLSQSIKIFGPDGTYIDEIGREGQGPGEFRGIANMVIGANDTLYVFDLMNGRLSVFDRNYDYVRTAGLAIEPTMFLEGVGHGHFAFCTMVYTPSLVGYPLHLVNAEGEVLNSFGSETGEFLPPDVATRVRMAGGNDGRVWIGFPHEYKLELWDAFRGLKIRQIQREVEWFTPRRPERPRFTVNTPPPTKLWLFAADNQDRLWVQVLTADPGWRDAVEEGGSHPRITDAHGYEDVILEVLDARSGRALARMKFDRGVVFVDPDRGLIGSTVIDEQQLRSRFKIWRVELVPRRGGT